MAERYVSDMEHAFRLAWRARTGLTDAQLPEYEFSMQQGPWTVLGAEDGRLVGRIFQWARRQPFGEGYVVAEDQDETIRFFGIRTLRKEHPDNADRGRQVPEV